MNRPRSSPWASGSTTITSAMTSDSLMIGTSYSRSSSCGSGDTVANALRKKRRGEPSLVPRSSTLPMMSSWSPASWTSSTSQSTQARLPSMTGEPVIGAGRQLDAVEFVPARDGEAAPRLDLPVGEDVDAEGPGPGDPRPTGRRASRRHRHEGRVDRERDEALAGEAHRSSLLDACHHRHPGGEAAHGLLEPLGVDTQRQAAPRSMDVPSAAAVTSRSRLGVSRRACSSRRSISLSVWAGSWWNRLRRRAPASRATSTA